jgi:hypothetical protein
MKFGFEVEIVPTSFIMILLIAAMGVPALIQPISAASDDFTIIALPDTQVYSQSSLGEEIYTAQTQWIVDNKVGFNIVFVVHEGDIVETWNSDIQWTRVSASMALLDDNVPYSVVPGNHDHEDATTTGSTSYYNTYFPTSRFNTESWWGGNFHDNDNNYQLMTIGSDDYIFLSLDYCADNDEIAWANSVLDTYSDRKAILTTHGYLDSSGNRDSCGNNIWTNLVYDHSNLQIVLCGHALGEALRTDSNQEGKSVYQMLADYQGRTNGGNGWLRILTFKPSEDKIYVQTYSPYLDEYETDTNSQFTLDYDMTSDGTQSCSDTITRTETQTFIETRTETVTGSGSSGDAWACDACQYRMKLTFQNSASSQSLVNFPVLIKLDSSRIDYSKTSVTDIRFYDGTTLLSKETELWNAAGDSFIWVKVPQIDNVDTDYIYAYYGCSDTNNDDAENVWDSNYMMVHHLEETSDIQHQTIMMELQDGLQKV